MSKVTLGLLQHACSDDADANLKKALTQIAAAVPGARNPSPRTGVEIMIPSDTGYRLILPHTTVYKHTFVVTFEL